MKNKKVKSKHLGGNWYSGECGDYTFQAKAFVEPSDYGIDCGKVSKLHIQKDDLHQPYLKISVNKYQPQCFQS